MMQSEHFDTTILDGDQALVLERFARACDTEVSVVLVLVDEGLLQPEIFESNLRFNGHALARARTILRLQKDFEANLESVAVMIGLLDEIDRLRARLYRRGHGVEA